MSYFSYLRKKSKHIQYLHALVFSFLVTGAGAGTVLYYDYGFWHETYTRGDVSILSEKPQPLEPEGPFKGLERIFVDMKDRLGGMNVDASFLNGTEVYTKPE